jgi:hypothetical protein
MTATRTILRASLALFALACGSSAPPIEVSPFTEEHAEIFEDGADFIEDPESLEGRWREDWSRDLDRRVTHADVIAVVTIQYLRTDTNPDRQTTYRLIAKMKRTLVGEPPEEVEMTVAEGQGGFATIEGNDRRILNEEFLAFLKWYRTEAGEIAPHWHLSPASEPIVDRVEYLIERRRDIPRERGRTTTVVH